MRVVVPGFIGARSVKWVTAITVQPVPSDNYFQALDYRIWPADSRAFCGVPPAKNGDFAFIQHMITSMKSRSGRIGGVMPHANGFDLNIGRYVKTASAEVSDLPSTIIAYKAARASRIAAEEAMFSLLAAAGIQVGDD